jgi:hypothetical protein
LFLDITTYFLLEIVIEGMDHPPFVKNHVLHVFVIVYTSKEDIIVSMEYILIAFRLMQQKINHFVSLLSTKYSNIDIIKMCFYNTTSNKRIIN